jgi:hypothetical protein
VCTVLTDDPKNETVWRALPLINQQLEAAADDDDDEDDDNDDNDDEDDEDDDDDDEDDDDEDDEDGDDEQPGEAAGTEAAAEVPPPVEGPHVNGVDRLTDAYNDMGLAGGSAPPAAMTLQVACPPHAMPGESIDIITPAGEVMHVVVPPGVEPGENFDVHMPPASPGGSSAARLPVPPSPGKSDSELRAEIRGLVESLVEDEATQAMR